MLKLRKKAENAGKTDAKSEKSPEKVTKKNERNKETFPKNINEYRHIIDTFKVTDKDLEWVLELRSHPVIESIQKDIQGQAPTFNSDKTVTYKGKSNWEGTYRGLSTSFEHLMRKRIGEQANQSQLEFEMTLRDKKANATNMGKEYKHPHLWDSTSTKPVTNYIETFLPPVMKSSLQNLKVLDKENVIIHPYIVTKQRGDDRNLKITYQTDNAKTLAFIGEHKNMGNYSWKYQNSNVNSIRHVLGQTSNNSMSKWTVGLRDFYNDNNAGKNMKETTSIKKGKSKEKEIKKEKK